MAPRPSLALRIALAIVGLASRIVPRAARSDWRQEWESELHHGAHRPPGDLLRRSLGTLPDAAWIRRQFTADAEVVHDIRHAMRLLASSPGFTVTAVAILAVGIGGTLSIGALVDTLWLRTLPYQDAERVMMVWQRDASGQRGDVAPANFLDWRERSRSFSSLAAVVPHSYDLTDGDQPEVAFGAQVTERFFETIGTSLLLGRTFLPGEHRAGAGRVVIISEGLWRRRFAADPAIVGSPISLDGSAFTIVGVLPGDFRPQLMPRPGELSIWAPKIIQDYETGIRGSAWWNVVGRLAPGVTLSDARREMHEIAGFLAREHPRTNERTSVDLVPLREHLMGTVRVPLLVMFGAILVVLLIGCANVANLLLARAAFRGREFAIRAALGAGRARIVRQLMVESLVLAALGAAPALRWRTGCSTRSWPWRRRDPAPGGCDPRWPHGGLRSPVDRGGGGRIRPAPGAAIVTRRRRCRP